MMGSVPFLSQIKLIFNVSIAGRYAPFPGYWLRMEEAEFEVATISWIAFEEEGYETPFTEDAAVLLGAVPTSGGIAMDAV